MSEGEASTLAIWSPIKKLCLRRAFIKPAGERGKVQSAPWALVAEVALSAVEFVGMEASLPEGADASPVPAGGRLTCGAAGLRVSTSENSDSSSSRETLSGSLTSVESLAERQRLGDEKTEVKDVDAPIFIPSKTVCDERASPHSLSISLRSDAIHDAPRSSSGLVCTPFAMSRSMNQSKDVSQVEETYPPSKARECTI